MEQRSNDAGKKKKKSHDACRSSLRQCKAYSIILVRHWILFSSTDGNVVELLDNSRSLGKKKKKSHAWHPCLYYALIRFKSILTECVTPQTCDGLLNLLKFPGGRGEEGRGGEERIVSKPFHLGM